MNRPSASERRSITASPGARPPASRPARSLSGACSACCRLPAMDRMGASELLISWPSTRTSRCQAWRSSSRSARRRSVSTTSSCGSPPRRKALRRSSHWPCAAAKRRLHRARGLARQQLRQAQVRGAGPQHRRRPAGDLAGDDRWLAQQPLAGRVDQPQPVLAVEGEHGDVDLRHHLGQQRGGLGLAGALARQGVGQAVDLQQRLAEGVARLQLRPAAADGVVALAQRRQQVGDGLQRAHHPLAQGQRAAQPHHHDAPAPARPAHLRAEYPPNHSSPTASATAGSADSTATRSTRPSWVMGSRLTRCLLSHGAAAGGRARCATAPARGPRR